MIFSGFPLFGCIFLHVCHFYSFYEIFGVCFFIEILGFIGGFLFQIFNINFFLHIFFSGLQIEMQVIYLCICISLLTRCDIFTNVQNK